MLFSALQKNMDSQNGIFCIQLPNILYNAESLGSSHNMKAMEIVDCTDNWFVMPSGVIYCRYATSIETPISVGICVY